VAARAHLPRDLELIKDQVHGQKILLATNNYRQHEVYHEKGHNPWQSRWSGVIDCGALLASMVAKDCEAIP
jgi:hypothetical protein